MTPEPVVRYLMSNPTTITGRSVYRTCQVETDGVVTETINVTQPTGYPRGFMLRDDGTITIGCLINSSAFYFWYYDTVMPTFEETGVWFKTQNNATEPVGNWSASAVSGIVENIELGVFGSITVDDIRYGLLKGEVSE